MKSGKATLYLALVWLLTVGVAFVFGWYTGVKDTTHIVAGSSRIGIEFILGVLAVVTVAAVYLTFRIRGAWDNRGAKSGAHLTDS